MSPLWPPGSRELLWCCPGHPTWTYIHQHRLYGPTSAQPVYSGRIDSSVVCTLYICTHARSLANFTWRLGSDLHDLEYLSRCGGGDAALQSVCTNLPVCIPAAVRTLDYCLPVWITSRLRHRRVQSSLRHTSGTLPAALLVAVWWWWRVSSPGWRREVTVSAAVPDGLCRSLREHIGDCVL